jgi:hypothetical protein
MYALLRRFLSPRWAAAVLVVWYALLLLLLVRYAWLPSAEFRYGGL